MSHHERFGKDIESMGFKVNGCDPCVANEMVNGKQLTACWHADDTKASHADPKAIDQFMHCDDMRTLARRKTWEETMGKIGVVTMLATAQAAKPMLAADHQKIGSVTGT